MYVWLNQPGIEYVLHKDLAVALFQPDLMLSIPLIQF